VPSLTDREIDDEIASDWNAILERHAPEEGQSDAEAQTAEAPADGASDETELPAQEKPAREADRDRAGRFKPGNRFARQPTADAPAREDAQDAQPETGEAERSAPAAEPAAEAVQRDIARAPSTWRPTARAEWGKLPETVRAEIHRRESDFMAGQSQLLPDAKFGKDIRGIVEPYRMLIESQGGTPESAVQELLRTAAMLQTGTPQQKYQTMAAIAQRYGVDLRAFAPRTQQGGSPAQQAVPQNFRDPRLDELLTRLNTAEQQRQAAEQRSTEDAVTRWMNEADAEGNPKRPYAGDVINEMSALIPQLKAQDPTLSHQAALDAAYERAIWAHPEIRTLLVNQQQAAAATAAAAANQQRAQAARRGASVNVPRRGSTPAPAKPGSLEETIAATARELGIIG
jgi:hypothetical protein